MSTVLPHDPSITPFRNPRLNGLDVTVKLVKEKPSTAAKAIYVFIDCLREAGLIPKEYKDTVDTVHHHAKLVKLFGGFGKLLEKGNKFRDRVTGALEKESFSLNELWVCSRALNDCVGPVWDIVDFFTKTVVHISRKHPWVEGFKAFAGCSLAGGMGVSAVESAADVWKNSGVTGSEKEQVKKKDAFWKAFYSCAMQVSYAVLGALSAIAILFNVAIAQVIFTIFSASAVVWTLASHYHENLGKERKFAEIC